MSALGNHSDSSGQAGSICLTEDLDNDDNATQYSERSAENIRNTEAGRGDASAGDEHDLDALLGNYDEEQEQSSKCQSWLNSSGGSTSNSNENKDAVDASTTKSAAASSSKSKICIEMDVELPPEADIPIEKMAALVQDSLRTSRDEKAYPKFGSDSEDEQRVPLSPIRQIEQNIKNNLPFALMDIISYLFSEQQNNQQQEQNQYAQQMRKFLIKVLRHATNSKEDPLSDKSATAAIVSQDVKFKSFAEAEEIRNKYFASFKIVLRANTRMNKAICEKVELYVNERITSSKILQNAWIWISNRDILNIISATNDLKFLALSPEKVAKYALQLQIYIWDNILQRCITLFKDLGFDLLAGMNSSSDNPPEYLNLSSQDSSAEPEPIPAEGLIWSGPINTQAEAAVADAAIGARALITVDAVAVEEVQLRVQVIQQAQLEAFYQPDEDDALIAAIVEAAGGDHNLSQSSVGSEDPELESLRGFNSQSSYQSYTSLSPQNSLPTRSPDLSHQEINPNSPRLFLQNGMMNEMYMGSFGNMGSQDSQDSNSSFESSGGGTKRPRLELEI